jgi:beta-aspartyl-peptidase (threonine type)
VKPNFGIVIHGGAGTILRFNMTPELETAYNEKLNESIQSGYDILKNGGSALDATQKAVNVMEDSDLFNAGKGAVFTHDGENEQDATIICGKTLNTGAVAGVRHVKNPIDLARAVMDKSEHVLFGADGAEKYARLNNIELVDKEYFFTEKRWQQLEKIKEKESKSQKDLSILDHSDNLDNPDDGKHGTVGAVALDKDGNLAAATSSGGMTNKKFGRIGDSALLGAGTYANNKTCAISTTGHGEYFIRCLTAYDVSAMMEYQNKSLQEAAELAIHSKLEKLGGTGGLIGIDTNGNITLPFNTKGMYRGYLLDGHDKPEIAIFKDV